MIVEIWTHGTGPTGDHWHYKVGDRVRDSAVKSIIQEIQWFIVSFEDDSIMRLNSSFVEAIREETKDQ